MKKTLMTTLLIMTGCLSLQANAGLVVMDYQGDTIVRPNSIERNMLLNNNDTGEYDVFIKPLDDALTRSDGEVRIPLEYVYINNTHEDVFMRYNEYSTIFRHAVMAGVAKPLTVKVRDFGMIPAGVYNLNIEIQAVDSETSTVDSTSIFNLQMIVPTVQEMNFHGETARINIGTRDAFARNKKIPTETNPMLYINSNCDWILTVDTNRFGEAAGNYYIRTVSASPAVNERLQERVLIQPGKDIIIAKGKAPANNAYVAIECSVEGKDGEVLPSGHFMNYLKFVLEEDRR